MAAGAVSSARDTPHDVRWKWLLLGLWALTAIWTVFSWTNMFGSGGRPWFGWWDDLNVPGGEPYHERVESIQPGGGAAKSGLRDGDWFDLREQNLDTRDRIFIGQPMATQPTDIAVHRGSHTISIPVVGSTILEGDVRTKLFDYVPSMISSIWFLGCAILVVTRRALGHIGRVLSIVLLLMSLQGFTTQLPNAAATVLVNMVVLVLVNVVMPILLVRLSSVMGTSSKLRRVLELCAYVAIAAVFANQAAGLYGVLTLRLDPMIFGLFGVSIGTWDSVFLISATAVAAVAIAATVSSSAPERARMAWLLLPIPLALLVSTAVTQLEDLVNSWQGLMVLTIGSSLVLLVGAATVTYALLRRRVLDFGFVLNRAVVVSIVGLIVVIAFVLLEWVLGSVLTGVSHATGLIANATLALVIGVSLSYVHKRVDKSVDLVLFRKRHEDEKSLLAFSKEAAYITEWDALLDATLEKIRRHTDARSASVLIRVNGFYSAVRSFGDNTAVSLNENDEAILALKVWHRPIDPHHYETALRAALALPMLSRGKLYGVLTLGERAGGEAYAPDEVEALSQLANGVGSALEALSLTTDGSATALAELGAELHQAIASIGGTLAEMRSEMRALRTSSPT